MARGMVRAKENSSNHRERLKQNKRVQTSVNGSNQPARYGHSIGWKNKCLEIWYTNVMYRYLTSEILNLYRDVEEN
jgi:hypothetical protein